MIKIAKNPKNFTFIAKCQPDIDIVVGDARLTMAKEPDGSFDLFIIDAFSSDAIPVHLLTAEAVKMYLDKLKPDGVVLLHTSNRYLDLESVLGAIHARSCRRARPASSCRTTTPTAAMRSRPRRSSIFAKSEQALAPYRSLEGVMRARRRRLAGLDRRLLRHPGSVPEQAAEGGGNADTLRPRRLAARRSGAIGKTASGVPAAAQTTS